MENFKTTMTVKLSQLAAIQVKKREVDILMDRCNEDSMQLGATLQDDIRTFLLISEAAPRSPDPDQEQHRLRVLTQLRELQTTLGRNQEKIIEQSKSFDLCMKKVTEIQTMLSNTVQSVQNINSE